MFKFVVSTNGAQDALKEFRRMLPYVAAKTLTGLGEATKGRMPYVLRSRFDRPTNFTINAAKHQFANKGNLRSAVGFPQSADAQGKGRNEFIRPGAEGAMARRQKRTEYLLTRQGWLPAGWITVPGSHAKRSLLDGSGNIPGSIYKQLINVLQIRYNKLKPISKASQKRAAGMGVDREFFAVAPGTNSLGRNHGYLPAGVYRRTRKGLQQYLLFVKRAAYTQKFDMREVGVAVAKNQGPAVVRAAFADVRAAFAARAAARAAGGK